MHFFCLKTCAVIMRPVANACMMAQYAGNNVQRLSVIVTGQGWLGKEFWFVRVTAKCHLKVPVERIFLSGSSSATGN